MRARIHTATVAGVALTVLSAVGVAAHAIAATADATAAQVVSNIAYAPAQPAGGKGHLLDLYLPSGGTGLRPLVIWSTGSAWMADNGKDGAGSVASAFNAKGWAVAGVSVRSSAQAKFPAQVYDVKAAIRWLRANAAQYQLDPNRFVAMGDSSGGWLADMATLTSGVTALEGNLGTTGVSSAVQAGVGLFGPTDFLQMNAQRVPGGMDHDGASSPESQLVGCAIQTCPEKVRQANPITYVDRDDPPLMLLHGQVDSLVPHGQSVLLYNALKTRCRNTQFFSVPGANHGTSDVLGSSHYGGQTVYTVSGCQETTRVGTPNPSWDVIESWLRTALGDTPGPTPTTSQPTNPPTNPPTSPPTGLPTNQPTNPPAATCRVGYTANTWNTGFTAEVTITNTGTSAVNGWTLGWTWPGNQQVTSAWNATVTQSGSQVTARNVGFNGAIAPAGTASFGFQAGYSDTNTAPAQFTLNGTACVGA